MVSLPCPPWPSSFFTLVTNPPLKMQIWLCHSSTNPSVMLCQVQGEWSLSTLLGTRVPHSLPSLLSSLTFPYPLTLCSRNTMLHTVPQNILGHFILRGPYATLCIWNHWLLWPSPMHVLSVLLTYSQNLAQHLQYMWNKCPPPFISSPTSSVLTTIPVTCLRWCNFFSSYGNFLCPRLLLLESKGVEVCNWRQFPIHLCGVSI